MPTNEDLQCYNRGCGQKYDPNSNKEDSCRHHPGEPFFHDAYKGWSCCQKKCTDFTEFLNIKGCTLSKHSNIKPPEPEKLVQNNIPDTEIIEVKPIVRPTLQRPPFDSSLTTMKPEIAPSLKQQLNAKTDVEKPTEKSTNSGEITIGTSCKNGGCTTTYTGPETNDTICTYHPGVPIFHEGMKYWSCCQRKTSDFDTFLSQVGCEQGNHVWIKDDGNDSKMVQCRWDYHQTGSFVVVSIYAKEYCPTQSMVQLNPVRLRASLVFPKQDNATFELDVELRGVISVEESHVTMYGTKVEIKLKKAEPGSWAKLEIPRPTEPRKATKINVDNITPKVEAVDLDDVQLN